MTRLGPASMVVPSAGLRRRVQRSAFFRLLALAAPFKGWMALAVLCGSLTIGSSIGLMAASAFILASAARHPSVADLAVAVVAVRAFGIARGVFRYLERLVSHHVNFQLLVRLRVWFYQAIEPRVPAQWANARSGDWLSRFASDIETLQNFYVRVLAPPWVAIVIAVAMGLYLAGFAPRLAAIVLGFMFLAGAVLPAAIGRMSAATGRALVEARSRLSVEWVDAIQGMADLVAYGREREQAERMNALGREWVHLQGRMASATGLHNALGSLLAHAAMWSVLLLAIPLVRAAQLDGVYLPVLALAVLASFEGVLALPLAFQYLGTNLQAARRLFEVADADDGDTDPKGFENPSGLSGKRETMNCHCEPAIFAGEAIPNLDFRNQHWRLLRPFGARNDIGNDIGNAGIVFENVSFRYRPGEALALDRVSFQVRAGERVAIVGPSGAGKSTLINLLLRFWDDYDGCIVIGGCDLREYDPAAARRLFGVVSQSTYLFNLTIRQNLLLGRPDATEEQMVRAARQAQAHEFIRALPAGYDTLTGEQGLQLSGGERQRLALARALLQEAPFLLLDEPTANLDPVTERGVLAALQDALGDRTRTRTTLMLTHRLAGLAEMDEVLVLRDGRVVERGTHADLLQLDGWYRRMWDLERNRIPLSEFA